MRLSNSPHDPVGFTWNGTRIEGREGDTVAAALHAAGTRYLIPSRKFHQPRGLSGSFIAGHLATVDGVPNCRLDRIALQDGMTVAMQGVWPSAGLDLLRLNRMIPRRWLGAGFEHPRLIPDQSFLWRHWERALAFVAGGAPPPRSPVASIPAGQRIRAGTVIVGGGPAAKTATRTATSPIVLITRGPCPSALPEGVRVYSRHEVFALYDGGKLVAAAPLDACAPALLIDADQVVLASGLRSTPPLVRGAALPGVMDASMALRLARDHGVAPGKCVTVIGTPKGQPVYDQLAGMDVNVVGFFDVATVASIQGRHSVTGLKAGGRTIPCDAVVHAGPWRPDKGLRFQASWGGDLRLVAGDMPDSLRIAGSASEPPEPVSFGSRHAPDGDALVCPCMDVTVGEVVMQVARGVRHVEEIKRLTGCGMGPCQGVPCWDLLAAVVGWATGQPPETVGHPTYRPPRAALTFAQAAGLDDVTEIAP